MSDTTIPATAALLDGWRGPITADGYDTASTGEIDDGVAWYYGRYGEDWTRLDIIRLDLTIPAVRDRVVRVMAEALGLNVGATAPGWGRYKAAPTVWEIECGAEMVWFASEEADGVDFVIPSISEVTNPIVSLALAWRAVCGGGE